MDLENVGRERAWLAAVVALVVVLVGGSLLFPGRVYGGFVWHYFWGPVYADANNAACAVWNAGSPRLLDSAAACRGATGPVAYPGYTPVSEAGYAITLLFMLTGVVFLLERLGVGEDRGLFYGLLPFMFFGGALRVVEDADNAVGTSVHDAIHYPWNALIISPIIYFTVFAVAVAALVVAVWLERTGRVERYEYPLAGIGAAALALTLAYLLWLAATTPQVSFHPQFTVLTLLFATLAAGGTWYLLERMAPEVNVGTGLMGLLVIWGHAVDGVSNVIGLNFAKELGLPADLVPKHPVNRAIIDVTQQFLPASVIRFTGDAWPFLVVKLVVATGVVWVFNDDIFEESPRFTVLLLIAILAVGLGPGTRDMLRATFGV